MPKRRESSKLKIAIVLFLILILLASTLAFIL